MPYLTPVNVSKTKSKGMAMLVNIVWTNALLDLSFGSLSGAHFQLSNAKPCCMT